jgi:hypothetical protein
MILPSSLLRNDSSPVPAKPRDAQLLASALVVYLQADRAPKLNPGPAQSGPAVGITLSISNPNAAANVDVRIQMSLSLELDL